MMRGVDYRSDGKGLVLVIGKSFSTARDAEQGLARVGRFGDQSYRTILKGIELVDKDAYARNYSAFYKFAESCMLPRANAKKRHAKAAAKDAER